MVSSILQGDVGARNEVPNRPRYENLGGPGQRCNPRADIDGDTAHIVLQNLDDPGVDSTTNLDSKFGDQCGYTSRTMDASAGFENVIRKPSPVVTTSWPRHRANSSLIIELWRLIRSRHFR